MELLQLWNRKNVPLAEQYETLAAIVFPESRPAEIFLYSEAIAGNSASIPALGRSLVTMAVKIGRSDDLAQRIASRENQPQAQRVAAILKTLLEAETITD